MTSFIDRFPHILRKSGKRLSGSSPSCHTVRTLALVIAVVFSLTTNILPTPTVEAASDSTILYPVADGYAWSGGTEQSSGASSTGEKLRVGFRTAAGNYRTLIKFDLSSIPAGVTITNAALKLYYYAYSSGSEGNPLDISVYRTTVDWNEGGLSWSKAENYNSFSYDTVTIIAGSGAGYKAWDITSLVQNWVDGTYSNYGVLLRAPTQSGSSNFRSFRSKEYGSNIPKLEVTYTTPPQKPDLIVDDIWVDPDPPDAGGSNRIRFKIKNQGSGDAVGTFKSKLYFDGVYKVYADTSGLTAASTKIYYWDTTWPSDTNWHTIKVVVDVDEAITESNEGNNELSEQFKAIAIEYTLTTSVIPSGGGSVNLNPSGGTYNEGTQVTLTANEAPGYSFVHWGGPSTSSWTESQCMTNPVTITMDGNKDITANFENLTITVASPNDGETWDVGSTHDITWTVSGDTSNISYFKLAYSTDGGSTYPYEVTAGAVSSTARSYSWTIPNTPSTQCRVRVRAIDAETWILGPDTSDANFTIAPSDVGLAAHWAPVWYQDTDSTDCDADYITNFNFDGNWIGTDNWENQPNYSLKAYVYYWVVETETHWFIGYADFHPRDWNEINTDLNSHENDMEGILLVIKKDGSTYGQFLLMITLAHIDFYSYKDYDALPSKDVTEGHEDIDGDVKFYETHHPYVYVEAKGHGVYGDKRWESENFPGGDGVVYYHTIGTPQEPSSGNDRYVPYALRSIDELWERRYDYTDTFYSFGTFKGDTYGENKANAPWGWDDHDDGDVFPPDFFTDPAYLVDYYHDSLGTFSHDYVYKSYGNTPPPKPALSSPPNDATITDTTWTLHCNPVTDSDGDSVSYYFRIDDEPAPFSEPYIDEGWGSGTSFTTTTLTMGGTYYWHVWAYDGEEFSEQSDTWSFYVASTITVTGKFEYFNQNTGQNEPVRYATVKLFDDDPLGWDELAVSSTNAEGEYTLGPVTNGDWDFTKCDIFVAVYTDTTATVVKNGSGTTYQYKYPSTPAWDVSDGIHDFGTRNVDNDGAWHIMDVIIDAYQWLDSSPVQDNGNDLDEDGETWDTWNQPKIDVYWPMSGSSFSHGYYINIDDEWDIDTIQHEYGHAVMWKLYDDGFPSRIYVGDHWYDLETDPGFALIEGWAEFFPCVIQNSADYHGWNWEDPDPRWYNWNDVGDMDGNIIEGSVSTILWDISDDSTAHDDGTPGTDDDSLTRFFLQVWNVLRDYRPDGMSDQGSSITDFWDSWILLADYGYRAELNAIYWDHGIDENTPPSCSISSPNGGGWYSGNITVSATGVSDIDGSVLQVTFQYSLDHSTWNDIGIDASPSDGWSISWDSGTITDSTVWVRARAFDGMEWGDWDESDSSFGVDNAPPDTSITSGPSGTITYDDVTFQYTGSDDVTPTSSLVYSYKLEGYDSDWSSYTLDTSKTYNNLPDGSYTFKVKAKDGVGNVDPSPASMSFTVLVDMTPPTVPIVTDDGDYTSSTTQLHASWSSSDAESGIAEYQYAIGTSPGGTDVVGWTSAGTNTEVTATGLSLSLGTTYYFAVKAKNGVGLWSDVGTSDGITVLMEGDVNLDGHVTTADALLIARYSVGLETLSDVQLTGADTNDDGRVTTADAMHIAQWVVDPDGSAGVLTKPLWESPADDELVPPQS